MHGRTTKNNIHDNGKVNENDDNDDNDDNSVDRAMPRTITMSF